MYTVQEWGKRNCLFCEAKFDEWISRLRVHTPSKPNKNACSVQRNLDEQSNVHLVWSVSKLLQTWKVRVVGANAEEKGVPPSLCLSALWSTCIDLFAVWRSTESSLLSNTPASSTVLTGGSCFYALSHCISIKHGRKLLSTLIQLAFTLEINHGTWNITGIQIATGNLTAIAQPAGNIGFYLDFCKQHLLLNLLEHLLVMFTIVSSASMDNTSDLRVLIWSIPVVFANCSFVQCLDINFWRGVKCFETRFICKQHLCAVTNGDRVSKN